MREEQRSYVCTWDYVVSRKLTVDGIKLVSCRLDVVCKRPHGPDEAVKLCFRLRVGDKNKNKPASGGTVTKGSIVSSACKTPLAICCILRSSTFKCWSGPCTRRRTSSSKRKAINTAAKNSPTDPFSPHSPCFSLRHYAAPPKATP